MYMDKVEVKTYKVKAMCNTCYRGEMELIGALTTYPQKYPHKCSHCGSVEDLDMAYPYFYTE